MKVESRSISCGITRAARALGVSYNHLWRVMKGKASSPPLLLRIERMCPSLFSMPVCEIKWKQALADARRVYTWNGEKFVRKAAAK